MSFSWLYNVAAYFLSNNNNNNNNNNNSNKNNAYLKDKVSCRVQYLGQKNGHTKCKVLEDCTQKHIMNHNKLVRVQQRLWILLYYTRHHYILPTHGWIQGKDWGSCNPLAFGKFSNLSDYPSNVHSPLFFCKIVH